MSSIVVKSWAMAGPGLSDSRSTEEVLRGSRSYTYEEEMARPTPEILAPNERRRTTVTIRLALKVAEEAAEMSGVSFERLPAVFSSSDGDMEIADKICRALSLPGRPVSPTHFHNSVHNAAAGYWAIASGSHCTSTSISVYGASAASGLLESFVQAISDNTPVLMVAYEYPAPHPLSLAEAIPIPFAVAMVVAPNKGGHGLQLTTKQTDELNVMTDPGLEHLRSSNYAAQLLPLITLIAREERGRIALPYVDDQKLIVECM